MKKFIPLLLAFLIGAALGALFVTPGFQKRTDVYLQKFSVSEDGSAVTVQTFTTGSMGYIRAVEPKQIGNEIHCSFYSCFGGLNSSFGAKSRFEIQADDSAEKIYFDRGMSFDQLILERDAGTSVWVSPSPLPQ
ncbi:MAG: hypothetical protein HFF98_09255 [Oscillibacter sp.]|jgi:hypothetical protein|nr:hypothetical protein [Oscillibacter sp.]